MISTCYEYLQILTDWRLDSYVTKLAYLEICLGLQGEEVPWF